MSQHRRSSPEHELINQSESLLSRREFGGKCLAALAGAACLSAGLMPGSAFGNDLLSASEPEMPMRKFGNNGPKVSALSYCTKDLDKTGWDPLERAIQLGVNYIETSPLYEKSEEIIGENLLNSRERVILSTRWSTDGTASSESLIASFEKSRKRLKTHYIDIIILDDVTKITQLSCVGSRQAFSELKKEKRVKYIGFETHTNQLELLRDARKLGGFDIVMVSYNVYNYKDMAPVIEAAGRRGMGVLATEVVEGSEKEPNLAKRLFGKRSKSIPISSIRWALDDRWVSSVLVNPKSREELEEFVTATEEEE